MGFIIDIALISITALCVYRGFKGGIIRGVCGVLALIISIIGANIIATAYSGEFKGMLTPFVSGVVDTVIGDELHDLTDTNSRKLAFSVLRKMGLSEKAASKISDHVSENTEIYSNDLSDEISDTLCTTVAYIAVFCICFILLAIIFAVAGNLLNLVFSIPGLELLDSIIGAALGMIRGLIIIFVLAAVMRYAGIISPNTVGKTLILKFLVGFNPIASILGV